MNLLPLAIDSGTRTIEPGRALIILPEANGTVPNEIGTDASLFMEHALDDA